jgi:peptidyl-prolyl cis-trans isomerase C
MLRALLVALVPLAVVAVATAQGTLPPPAKAKPVAMVNGREIPETAVMRALKQVDKENWDKARPEIVGYLIENALVDHYLELLKIAVEQKDVDSQLATIKKEIAESKQDYAKVLEKMDITEAEFKWEIRNQLRWEKFVEQQGTDEKLKKLVETSPEIFDGSTVRARHILISPATNDEPGKAAALKKVNEIKAAIEKEVAAAVAKIPAAAAPLQQQRLRDKATDDAFAAAAREHSSCRSKTDGGDLREFRRMGDMVEPFAKAAFALKPFQISEPVLSNYGYHLILVTAKKPGEPTKFETIKGAVLEVYGTRLRDAVIEKMKADPNTKIEIMK